MRKIKKKKKLIHNKNIYYLYERKSLIRYKTIYL